MADLKPFSLYPRKIGKKKIYYVRYRMPDGTRLAGRSTGQTSRGAAEAYAWVNLRANRVVRKDVTLEDFAGEDFFSWENQWATDRRARGRRLSERACLEKTQKLKRHILPVLGGYKIVSINKAAIAELRTSMFRNGLSADTINKTLDCLKAVLESAEDNELLGAVPKIERASGTPRKRGILTNNEVQALFAQRWPDERVSTARLLTQFSPV